MRINKTILQKYKTIKVYFIIIILSFVAGIYLIEGYLTFWKDPKKEVKAKIYKKTTGLEYDTRSKTQAYKDLKKIKNNFTIRVTPLNFINKQSYLYPLSGVSNAETLQCNENGYFSMYKSDRYGFNNPDTEWDRKTIEFLLVGDSFAHGSCVNRPNDIASVLRVLTNKPVLNLGYAANGPLTEYATLREYLKPNVKKVIWVYYEFNDLLDLKNELKNRILINYLNDLKFSQDLKNKQMKIDELANNYIIQSMKKEVVRKKVENSVSYKIIRYLKFYNLRNSFKNIFRGQPEPQQEFIKILKQANELTSKNNAKLYFVYLPGYYKYKFNYSDGNYLKVKKIVNDLNIPFIDVHAEVFAKEENPLKLFPFSIFGHYTVEGYKKIAETIYKLSK